MEIFALAQMGLNHEGIESAVAAKLGPTNHHLSHLSNTDGESRSAKQGVM